METKYSEKYIRDVFKMSVDEFVASLIEVQKRGERFDRKKVLYIRVEIDQNTKEPCVIFKSPGILDGVPESDYGTLD
jgi:hypothetical protein